MAKVKRTKSGRKYNASRVSFTKANYRLFGVSILVLFIGYWALSQPPVDGFLSLTLAPILLVLGYCVLIPLAIMYTKKDLTQNSR